MCEHRDMTMRGTQMLAMLVVLAALGFAIVSSSASATPTVSPGVKRTFVGADPGTFCRYGYLCAFVRGDGGFYRFDFTRCNTRYRVARWYGRGFIVNSQFGGVTARFFTRSGSLYASRRARGVSGINWGPVWSLQVC